MNKLYLFLIACALSLSQLQATTTKEVFAKYPNKYFVETGTFFGDGVQMALDAGFPIVNSIELSKHYFNISKQRFIADPRVHLTLGSSAKVLGDVIKKIKEPITFWLDGHYCGPYTAQDGGMTPLLRELEQIKKHPIKTHTIMIDDIRDLGTKNLDKISLGQVITLIESINPKYRFAFEDGHVKNDVLVAYIPKRK